MSERPCLERASAEAAEQGIALVRVDCYAGDDGRLVKYYESQGFTRTETFRVGEWPGQILETRLPAGQLSRVPVIARWPRPSARRRSPR